MRNISEEGRQRMIEGGRSRKGSTLSSDARKKLSDIKKGKMPKYRPDVTGLKWSDASRKKLSQYALEIGRKPPSQKGFFKENALTRTPGYLSYLVSIREFRKKQNGGHHSFEEWESLKAKYDYTCPCCGKSEPAIKLSKDHIVPVSKSGNNNIDNLQPLCKSCNSSKRDKTILYSYAPRSDFERAHYFQGSVR